MSLILLSFVYLVYFLSISYEKIAAKEASGYVNVRTDAHMFWWLIYADNSNHNNANQSYPLVIWLQGGPGSSSTGFGNFMEIGPQDVNLKQRNTSWTKYANLLFIDNPVGTGYSYVTNDNAYSQNNTQIAKDLIQLLKTFFNKLPEFQSTPLYIFSESYGGKMTTSLAVELYETINQGHIQCNFQGIALGDSWISPIDSVATWGQYLYSLSFIDANERKQVDAYAQKIRDALKAKQYSKATDLWSQTENFVGQITDGVNWYNVLQSGADQSSKSQYYSDLMSLDTRLKHKVMRYLGSFHEDELNVLMNGPIKTRLNIPANVTWGGQSSKVFAQLEGDFMLPVVDQIDYLLNKTNLKVVVYTGQLDLIVDTIGTLNWIDTLKWSGLQSFQSSKKNAFTDSSGDAIAFYKTYQNFSFFWIIKAGHMVPTDAGNTALLMLQKVLQSK